MTVFNGSVTNDGRIGIYNTGLNDRYGGLSQFGGEVINNNSISISDIHGGLLINNRRANTVNLFGGEVISKDFIETATVRGGKLTNTYYMKEDGEPSGGSVENLTLLDGGHVENRHRVNNLVMSGGLFEHYADEENVKASLNESYFLQSANISGGTFIGNGNVIEMVLDTVLDTNLFTGHIQTLIMDENAALKFAVSTLEDFDKLRLGSINGSAKFFVDFGDFFSDNDWGFFDLKQLFVFDNPEGQWDDRDDWNQFQLSGLETGSYSVGDNGVVWQVSSKGQFTSNPEPATFAILGLAFAGAGFAARRRIKK